MTIEKISIEKAESLALRLPALSVQTRLMGEDADYYLISRDGFLSVRFDAAAIADGEIVYISDEGLRETLEECLESN